MAVSYPKWVENTVGKGEIARYEQFLLFLQCFPKACFPVVSKGFIVWEWVKVFDEKLVMNQMDEIIVQHYTEQALVFTCLQYKSFENTVGKGEIAGNQHFVFLPHNVFYPIKERNQHFSSIKFVVCQCFQFGYGPNLLFGKG